MRGLLILVAAVLAAAPAASADRTKDAAALARATAGRVAGAPVDCLDRRRSNDFQIAGRNLIFRVSPRLTYVNQVSPGCEIGAPRQALVFRSPSSQLCRGDIAESVDPVAGAGLGSCALGQFVPYERP